MTSFSITGSWTGQGVVLVQAEQGDLDVGADADLVQLGQQSDARVEEGGLEQDEVGFLLGEFVGERLVDLLLGDLDGESFFAAERPPQDCAGGE